MRIGSFKKRQSKPGTEISSQGRADVRAAEKVGGISSYTMQNGPGVPRIPGRFFLPRISAWCILIFAPGRGGRRDDATTGRLFFAILLVKQSGASLAGGSSAIALRALGRALDAHSAHRDH
jgi:hypothetical protein